MDINTTTKNSETHWDEINSLKHELNNVKLIWSKCLETIRTRVNNQSFKAWFEPIVPLHLDNNKFTLKVPSQFFYDWLEEHYYSLIIEVLTQITGVEMTIDYNITRDDPDSQDNKHNQQYLNLPHSQTIIKIDTPETTTNTSSVKVNERILIESCLNPRYTFDNYIKGESNQFARAAAYAVANNPGGTSFNPLVIYGGVGLGKTHLVHAIGNHALKSRKANRVMYTSSEKFTVDFVDAIQKDKINEFSNFYRAVELLIVDDIQFFAGKEKTQDYFFHTFNALHQRGKQIILSCDKPPKDLKDVNERLITRFQWGLTADIQPPDLEMRIAILMKKSQDDGIMLPQDIIEFIASNVTSNIRELEGVLIGILARASLENRKIDFDLVKDVIRSVVGEVRTHITIDEIQRVVCEHLSIDEDLIRAKTRKQEIVNARQIAMYLAKELTNASLKTIGLHFGGRDHSTVIHAYQTVEDMINTDPKQKQLIQHLKSILESRSQ